MISLYEESDASMMNRDLLLKVNMPILFAQEPGCGDGVAVGLARSLGHLIILVQILDIENTKNLG